MSRALALVLLLAAAVPGAPKKTKPPEVEVLEAVSHRTEGVIKLDGRVRNSSAKVIQGLIVLFDFMAPGGAVVSTQKCPVDEEVLESGKDAGFRVQMVDEVRAVNYRMRAEDKNGRDLRIANSGPFPID